VISKLYLRRVYPAMTLNVNRGEQLRREQ